MAGLFEENGTNVGHDIASAQKVVQQRPTPIMWSPLGGKIITGPELPEACPTDNITRRAYGIRVDNPYDQGDLHRASWDQTALLYAVRGPGAFFKEKTGSRSLRTACAMC